MVAPTYLARRATKSSRCAKSLVQTEVKESDVKRANDGVDARCFDVLRHVNGRSGYTAAYVKWLGYM
jgi:hypothetical protein